jgi:cysteine desulfurase
MIYFDNAATTKMKPKVGSFMKTNLDDLWFNASASYAPNYRSLLERSRRSILTMLGADLDDHIIFTSGGSEANALAIHKNFIITDDIEHSSILNSWKGYRVGVDDYGFVDIDEVIDTYTRLNSDRLISIQLANNEVGTIQNIKKIREYCPNAIIHTDAVQAIGHIPVNVKDLGVDMLSASAHKFGGPKGVGFLYVSKRAYDRIEPVIYGEQEDKKRGSTYNTVDILGMELALIEAIDNLNANMLLTTIIRNKIVEGMKEIECATLNGPTDFEYRLPGNLNYIFAGYKGEEIQAFLAEHAIYVSTGSACNSASEEPSHVLKAMGLSDDEANSSIRITVNEDNGVDEVDEFMDCLKEALKVLK